MPGIFAGNTKSLVFPVMCDGYLQLDYSEYTPDATTESLLRGGFWGHEGNFSIEAVITPYDVNGYGTKAGGSGVGFADSERTPPSLDQDNNVNDLYYQSNRYFLHSERPTHRMMLFYNKNFEFYLKNTTSNNFNQPAEYKIGVAVYENGSAIGTVESDPIILASDTLYGYYDSNGLYDGLTTSKTLLDATTTINGTTVTCDSTATIETGTEIFNSSGTSLGNATVASATTFTLTSATNYSASLYVSQPKEALYLETMYKIGCSYSTTGQVRIYLNSKLIKEAKLSKKVKFDATDSFIGQKVTNNSGTLTGDTSTQFMGELYEISMYRRIEPTLNTRTLNPGYHDILFYYRFGDE